MAVASGPPARRPSALAVSETISASPAISRRTWRGVAPSARSTAVSRRRWAIARPNVPATTNSATTPAMPPMAPKMPDQRLAVRGAGVARVGVGGVAAVEHVDAVAERSRSRARSSAGAIPGCASTPIALTRPGAPDSSPAVVGVKNSARLAAVAGAAGVGHAADAVGGLAAGVAIRSAVPTRTPSRVSATTSRGPDGRAARAQARTGSAPRSASRGPRTRSAPAGGRRAAGVEDAGGERHVADGARDAGDRGGAGDARAPEAAGAGTASTRSASSPRPIVTAGSARTTASAAAKRPGPGALERARHQQAGGVGERDGQPDRRRTRRRGWRGGRAGSARRSAASSVPQTRSGARRPARRSARRARRPGGRRP